MKTISKQNLIEKRNYLMKNLRKIGPFIEGSLGKVNRICGNKNCTCRVNPEKKHAAYYFTWKEKKKTQSLYVPVDWWQNAITWNNNYKLLKNIIKDISSIQKSLLKIR